ncbi:MULTISPECIES: DUF6452 family protein [unclassified Tenacibaculum]|uniref:DUF6452 family protein n=1 Tax=unclassified Tenacibaculum TaxID=2635139 RepID=UPI001F26C9C5|nr:MULTISPECIES: DUF6452 family protein [unclassified Tenacibaculum]MCF2874985.1 DUF6452 family protein [Tenacibaculum sp. Cn5-1]MCF2935061.1 DUF6452 family protein [Tenacibaculum sp. Cn5-34]MCG7511497.1 DUF6452 family protein [Tenacibaculum sp. Cn5-46]
MKKYILFFVLMAGLLSCERDDFCVQNPVTPNLVLRFYDKDDNSQTKIVERLSIIAQGKTDSLFTNQTTDSIAIPLNSLDTETVFTLKMNNIDNTIANNQIATLTVKYDKEDVYVSRSCGFRVIYKDVNLTHTGWIDNLSTSLITNIDNQAKAHVQVYH